MHIGELGERLGVNPKTIRYYESIGLLPEPARSGSGYRIYEEGDAERLGFIKAAQRLGLALDEVREILALREGGQAPCAYVRSVISREVADIDRRLDELHRLRGELVALEQRAGETSGEGSICGLIEHVRERPGRAAEIGGSPRRRATEGDGIARGPRRGVEGDAGRRRGEVTPTP